MPKVSSTDRSHRLARHIDLYGSEMPTACSACAESKSVCRVDVRSGRCLECVRGGRAGCDVKVSWSELDRLRDARLRLRDRTRAAIREQQEALERHQQEQRTLAARVSRLQQQLFLAEEKEETAMSVELRAIEEQEALEAVSDSLGPPHYSLALSDWDHLFPEFLDNPSAGSPPIVSPGTAAAVSES